jgi:hypothetical protein
MHKIDKELKKRLIIKRKIIKNKLYLLKQGELDQEKMLSPLTKHLENIENIIVSGGDEKKKVKEIPTCSIQQNIKEEAQSSEQPEVVNLNFQKICGELEDEEPLQALPRKYINDMIKDVQDIFDHKYGVRYDPSSESFKVGNSKLSIVNQDLIIQKKTYKGTKGLYELLFKKAPNNNYTPDDLKQYKEIILKTNAHKRYYQANQQIDGSKLAKYKNIIAPLFLTTREQEEEQQSTSGQGLSKEVNKNAIDLIYWDDPNELVERLHLLIASQAAGNFNHRNEIISIIEELREANIIE